MWALHIPRLTLYSLHTSVNTEQDTMHTFYVSVNTYNILLQYNVHSCVPSTVAVYTVQNTLFVWFLTYLKYFAEIKVLYKSRLYSYFY